MDEEGYGSGFRIGILMMILASVPLCFLLGAIFTSNIVEYTENTTIYSLKDNSAVYGQFTMGHFTIGQGIISSKPAYTYYIQDEGAYRLKSADSRISYIYEDEEQTPYIVTHYIYSESCFNSNKNIATINRYDFHVPKGTVISDYRLDSNL